MADLTPRRRPVDDASRELKRRKLQLDIQAHQLEIERQRVAQLEHEAQIARADDIITALEARIAELQALVQEEAADG